MEDMTVTSGAGGPLDGVRVVEMGQLIAGPFCGQLLGDFGAEVIKVEPPGQGDPMRQWGQPGYPLFWEVLGRNKRSVSIDLREPAGQALARRLIATADILVENFRPGTLERWGLSPDVLRKDHPGLIIVRVSGYGQDGPYAGRAGFGGIGEAMGDGAPSSAILTGRRHAWESRSAIAWRRPSPALAPWRPFATATAPARARPSTARYSSRCFR